MNLLKQGPLACLTLAGACMVGPAMAASPSGQHVSPVQSTADSAVVAQQQAQKTVETAAKNASEPSATVNYHGVMVAIDPETGRLREPTAAEREQLAAVMLQQDAAQTRPGAIQRPLNENEARATIKRNATGLVGVSMQLPQSQISYLTAERKADGRISIHHQGDTTATTVKAVSQ